jgi:hypothetical protein
MTDGEVARLRAIADRLPQLLADVQAGRVPRAVVEELVAQLADIMAVVTVELGGEAALLHGLPVPEARA